MRYEVIGTPQIQSEYTTDEFQTVMVVDLKREDGETGDVWIIAGVPDSQQGTSAAARTQSGYQDVWVFGDSADSWCPASFLVPDIHDPEESSDQRYLNYAGNRTYTGVMADVIDACRAVAIKAHRQRLSDEEMVICTGCGERLPKADAHYGTHCDNYSCTTWHCDDCWSVCKDQREAE